MRNLLPAFLLLFMGLLWLLAVPVGMASAQSRNCAPIEEIETRLGERYGEVPVWIGIAHDQRLVVYGDAAYSSFSVIILNPSGLGCMVASGQAWFLITIIEPIPGEEG